MVQLPRHSGTAQGPGEAAPEATGGPVVSGEELLAWRRRQLSLGGHASDLDWLLDLGGGVGWQPLQALRLHPQRPVQLQQDLAQLEQLWREHLHSAAPLQYLVGICPWRDLELQVAPGVLIPRQETELLVELALAAVDPQTALRWADLGTGSGCLAVALARSLPRSRGLAVDLSPDALLQATANLARAQVDDRVQLRQGSWWEPLRDSWGHWELVVSNPPYIPTAVWDELEPVVRRHEPALALDGGDDGLGAIRELAAGAAQALAPGGWLLLEHHHDQSEAVLNLLKRGGLVDVEAHRDLEGQWRFARGRRPQAAEPPT